MGCSPTWTSICSRVMSCAPGAALGNNQSGVALASKSFPAARSKRQQSNLQSRKRPTLLSAPQSAQECRRKKCRGKTVARLGFCAKLMADRERITENHDDSWQVPRSKKPMTIRSALLPVALASALSLSQQVLADPGFNDGDFRTYNWTTALKILDTTSSQSGSCSAGEALTGGSGGGAYRSNQFSFS